jgi:predicted Abi (CAAX) family protease
MIIALYIAAVVIMSHGVGIISKARRALRRSLLLLPMIWLSFSIALIVYAALVVALGIDLGLIDD